jgi:hypothetical protein
VALAVRDGPWLALAGLSGPWLAFVSLGGDCREMAVLGGPFAKIGEPLAILGRSCQALQ